MDITLFEHVSVKDKSFMARQLATMLSSGLNLDKSLSVLLAQVNDNRFLHRTLGEVLKDLQGGKPFSETLKKHPKVFDKVFINIVISGEAVGKLAEVMNRLADQLEKQGTFISKIKGALYYPAFIVVVMIIIAAIMMVKVIPPLKEIFEEFGTELPWTTRYLLIISDFVARNWIVTSVVLLGLVSLAGYFFKTKQGKTIIDRVAIKYTLGLGRDIYMARFSRTMAMLIEAGTPIIEAINITGEVMNNIVYRQILDRVAHQVEKGVNMSAQLEKCNEFPILIPQMISIGEQTGQLEEVLGNIADYYEEEADSKVKGLSSLFEPAIIVLIGLAVAFLVFSIIMPIYQVAQLG